MQTDRELRKIYWGMFYHLGDLLIRALTEYLTIPENAPQYQKIFQLNLDRYGDDDAGNMIIGIKMFDNEIYVMVSDPNGLQGWELAQRDHVEFPYSVTRLDLLIWIIDELESNYSDSNFWVNDTTGFKPQPIYEKEEP